MALKHKEELIGYFQNGARPTQQEFDDFIESALAYRGHLDFTGRSYLNTNNEWVGVNPSYGQAAENYNQDYGTSELPEIKPISLGIGFLQQGTILHHLELVGRVNGGDVEDILVQLSYQGADLDTGGFNSTNVDNKIILDPTPIRVATDFKNIQRKIVPLNDFILEHDGIIEFACKPVGSLTGQRFWTAQRRLHYTLPA